MNHVTLRQVHELTSTIRKYPFLYDKKHPYHRKKNVHGMTWDAIAATVYRDTWHTLTCAEKGKRAKQLQNCVRPEDYEFLLEMDRCATTVQQGIHMLTTAAYKNQNSFIVKDMQAASKDLERNNQILVDREEELFLEYLLPEYNKLNSNHKREALYQCHCILKKLNEQTTKVELRFPVNVKFEFPKLKVEPPPLEIKPEECITIMESDDGK